MNVSNSHESRTSVWDSHGHLCAGWDAGQVKCELAFKPNRIVFTVWERVEQQQIEFIIGMDHHKLYEPGGVYYVDPTRESDRR